MKIIDSDFDSFGLKLRCSHSPALLPDILGEFGCDIAHQANQEGTVSLAVACVQPASTFEQGVAVHRLG